jgi:peptidyl-prolyl cis-trans isomerase SurA
MRSLPLCLLLALSLSPPAARAEQVVDGLAAQVGSEIVLISEVMEAGAPAAARASAAGATEADLRQMFAEVLDQMIERALIRQVVKRAEIAATDAEVDEAIAGIARENGITPERLMQSVEAQGMPYAVYRERIRGEIEHAKVLNDVVAAQVRVDDGEVREIYDAQLANLPEGGEEFSVRLIVVTPHGEEPGAKAAACASVAAARARVLAGESFDAVAREVSEANPDQGGAQGWVHETELAGWMRPAVEPLAAGGVSELIESDFGCAIVRVEERRAFVPLPFDSAKARLSQRLFEERMAKQYAEFIEKLRAQTYIERKGMFADVGVNAPPPARDDTEPGF